MAQVEHNLTEQHMVRALGKCRTVAEYMIRIGYIQILTNHERGKNFASAEMLYLDRVK